VRQKAHKNFALRSLGALRYVETPLYPLAAIWRTTRNYWLRISTTTPLGQNVRPSVCQSVCHSLWRNTFVMTWLSTRCTHGQRHVYSVSYRNKDKWVTSLADLS